MNISRLQFVEKLAVLLKIMDWSKRSNQTLICNSAICIRRVHQQRAKVAPIILKTLKDSLDFLRSLILPDLENFDKEMRVPLRN